MRKSVFNIFKIIAVFALSSSPFWASGAEITQSDGKFTASGENYSVEFNSSTGSIVKITSCGKDAQISLPDGLWAAKFVDGKQVVANSATCSPSFSADKLIFKYTTAEIDVSVTVVPKNEHCDIQAKVTPKSGELLEFELPSKFRFPPEAVKEITFHSDTPRNMGLAVNSEFFKDNSHTHSSWEGDTPLGDKLYKEVFGSGLTYSQDMDAWRNVTKGKDADEWVPKSLMDLLLKQTYRSARTFGKGQADIEILNSPEGVFLGASRLGGKGALFRVGGWINYNDRSMIRNTVCCIINRAKAVAKAEKSARTKVGMIKLNGLDPAYRDWYNHINGVCKNVIELDSPEKVAAAMEDPEFLFIVNPYAEICPNPPGVSPEETARKIAAYVKAGGYWFDNEGLSFYRGIRPKKFYKVASAVPATIGDFFHLNMNGADIAYYSVQSIRGADFENPVKSFVVSRFEIGGDEKGGYLTRPFVHYMKPSDGTWETPKVRLNFGKGLLDSADAFCKANGVNKKLSQKLDGEFLRKFKDCVLLNIWASNLGEVKQITDNMPPKNIIHRPCYLLGGFDKQYPDHVPPRPEFSTPEDFKAYIAEIRGNGHLFMPYTNNSWWCDNPRGPTFVAAGEAPLSVDIKGNHYHETYGKNDGWTICMWHPAVRAANDKIVKDFTEDYPCDILFQDQTGARRSRLDFNPAAPNPNTYSDGFIFTARRDSKKRPLSTEDGWWGIANEEIQFCGMTFGIFPSQYAPVWSQFVWDSFPKRGIRLANLVSAMFHDKVSLSHHDLATGIYNDRQMALSIGMGITMMYSPRINHVSDQSALEFIKWMDRLQKSLASKYVGEKMYEFSHEWENVGAPGEEGRIRSKYGNISIFANMSDNPFQDGIYTVAPDGFIAEGDGVKAGMVVGINGIKVAQPCGYVVENSGDKTFVWIYSAGDCDVVFPYAGTIKSLKIKDGADLKFESKDGVVKFRMPSRASGDNKLEALVELELAK